MTKIDWEEHITAFRASSQSLVAYCAATGIKPHCFRYQLYKQKPKRRRRSAFQEFRVATELVITRDARGGLSLSGFDVVHLPQIISAWSRARRDETFAINSIRTLLLEKGHGEIPVRRLRGSRSA